MTDELRRHINLNQGERRDLAENLRIEQAVAMFLDLSQDHTWQGIADTLGISLAALKRLSQTPEFQNIYSDALSTVGHDPRLGAIKNSLTDLLPAAYRRLQGIITNTAGDDRTAMRAIEKLIEWTGAISGGPQDDPAMFQNFLATHGVSVSGDLNVLQVNLPPEYQAAFARFLRPENTNTAAPDGDIVDSVATEISEKSDAEPVPVSEPPVVEMQTSSDRLPSSAPLEAEISL